MRALLEQILEEQDPDLLAALRAEREPTDVEREAVEDILSSEFMRHVDADSEPTELGKRIDDLLGAFLLRFPVGE